MLLPFDGCHRLPKDNCALGSVRLGFSRIGLMSRLFGPLCCYSIDVLGATVEQEGATGWLCTAYLLHQSLYQWFWSKTSLSPARLGNGPNSLG